MVTTAYTITIFGVAFRLELWRDIFTYECERNGRREFVRIARHRFMPWRRARFVHRLPELGWNDLCEEIEKMKSD